MKRLCASLIIGICIPALLTGCIVKKEETPATAQEERSGDDTEKRGAAGNPKGESNLSKWRFLRLFGNILRKL